MSVFEKESLPTTHGKALVLPAHPPEEAKQVGEIDELVRAGYRYEDVIAVERNEAIADEIYRYYYDRCQVHCEELSDFFDRTHHRFSYIHLDFCARLSEETLSVIQKTQGHLTKVARLRASVSYTRRSAGELSWENSIRQRSILPLMTAAAAVDIAPERWARLMADIEDSTDSTQILGAAFLFNHFFGVNLWAYADICALEEPFIPEVKGRHLLLNTSRFTHREDLGRTSMFSAWVDAFPLVRETVPDQEWLVNYLHMYFSTLASPIVAYQPVIFGGEK